MVDQKVYHDTHTHKRRRKKKKIAKLYREKYLNSGRAFAQNAIISFSLLIFIK